MSSAAAPYRSSASIRPRFLPSLADDSFRRRIYIAVTLLLALLAWTGRAYQAHQDAEPIDFIVGDSDGYYLYLPSLLLDGDLNFQNQIALRLQSDHPPVASDFLAPDGSSRNRYPTGVALTLSPAFVAGHVATRLLYAVTASDIFLPNGYTIVYQFFCVTWIMALVTVAMILADDLIRRRGVPGWAAAAGIITYVIGSNFAYYILREPLMSHLAGASWIIIAVWAAERLLDQSNAPAKLWLLAAFAGSIAITCRITNVFMAPAVAWTLWNLWQQKRLPELFRRLPIIALGTFPLLLQFIAWHHLTGQVVVSGAQGAGYYDYEIFHWLHPALWQTLLSSRHGLFFWSPLLLFAAWGLVWHLRRRFDGMLIAWLLGTALLWYLNSAWYAWAFGQSFGHRAFLELAGLFILGTAFAFQSLTHLPKLPRTACLAAVSLCMLYSWVMMLLFVTHRVPRDGWLWGNEAETANMATYPPHA